MKEGRDQKRRNNQHCYQNPLHSPPTASAKIAS
jgi:hypothetical protein